MNTKEFLETSPDKRVITINAMLNKYENDSLRKVAEELKINYSTFCKEMAKGDYVYIKRDNKYYKFIRDTNNSLSDKNISNELEYLISNFNKLQKLIDSTENNYLILDKKVYSQPEQIVNKNIKINSLI
jgi:DNA-binding transcriptional regulator YhcF (GntR family)